MNFVWVYDSTSFPFLVGAFVLESALFLSQVFFRQILDLTLNSPLLRTFRLSSRKYPRRLKGTRNLFSVLCVFFSIFFTEGSLFLCNLRQYILERKGSPRQVFRHCATFSEENLIENIPPILFFLTFQLRQ